MDFINAFIAPKLSALIENEKQLELLRTRQEEMVDAGSSTPDKVEKADLSQRTSRIEGLIQQQQQKVQALVFELNALVETASKKFPSQTAPSARFACVVTFELKGVLYHARKLSNSNSRTRSRELFRVLNDILSFRNQIWQFYMVKSIKIGQHYSLNRKKLMLIFFIVFPNDRRWVLEGFGRCRWRELRLQFSLCSKRFKALRLHCLTIKRCSLLNWNRRRWQDC
jgi:hypothetical protein